MKILYINVNGFFNKLLEIKFFLFLMNFDILVIIEFYLGKDIIDDEIVIIGYKIVWCDWNDGWKGGGMVIYFVEYLDVYECWDINVNNFLEVVWIDVMVVF